MHPWIKSDKPGKCPICGMDLVPVYEGDARASTDTNMVVLRSDSITAINVQTEAVAKRPIIRTLHVIGDIQKNSATKAWFVFTVYERDLPWIKVGQTLEVSLVAVPDKIYPAKIQAHGTEAFADRELDPMNDSTKVRAEILNPPVEVPGFEGRAYFSGLHAESHIHAMTPEVLAVPRSAVLARRDVLVFVDAGGGGYETRAVKLGRIGDDYAEVLGGLEAGDKVVTHGGLLLDAEAQLKRGE
jgi:multidrug efflux pump subunit AcrA (membrane-fusion protein)